MPNPFSPRLSRFARNGYVGQTIRLLDKAEVTRAQELAEANLFVYSKEGQWYARKVSDRAMRVLNRIGRAYYVNTSAITGGGTSGPPAEPVSPGDDESSEAVAILDRLHSGHVVAGRSKGPDQS